MLAQADKGSREGLEAWCLYVLQGILNESQPSRYTRLIEASLLFRT